MADDNLPQPHQASLQLDRATSMLEELRRLFFTNAAWRHTEQGNRIFEHGSLRVTITSYEDGSRRYTIEWRRQGPFPDNVAARKHAWRALEALLRAWR